MNLQDGDEMLAYQRADLISHAAQIWARYGVVLEWHDRLPQDEEWDDVVMTVRVCDHSMAKQSSKAAAPSTLGVVMFLPERDTFLQTIYVSPTAVRRLMSRGNALRERALMERVVGQAVARIVAHELGHILLEMSGHSEVGLMKARFEPSDLVTPTMDHLQVAESDLERLARFRTANRNADENR